MALRLPAVGRGPAGEVKRQNVNILKESAIRNADRSAHFPGGQWSADGQVKIRSNNYTVASGQQHLVARDADIKFRVSTVRQVDIAPLTPKRPPPARPQLIELHVITPKADVVKSQKLADNVGPGLESRKTRPDLPDRSGRLIVPLTPTSTGCSFNHLDIRHDLSNESQIVVRPFKGELERCVIRQSAGFDNLSDVKRDPTRQYERMNIWLLDLSVDGQYFVCDANREIAGSR